MASNITYEPGYKRSVVVTDPAAPVSGDPIRFGNVTGIALTDEGEGGNDATHTSVDFGPFIADFLVHDDIGGGIAVGDPIFYDDADGVAKLNNDSVNGVFFGLALATVGAGANGVRSVMHTPGPGAGAYAALGVTTAKLANGAVTEAKINPADLTALVAKVVGDNNVIGGLPILFHIKVAAGANGDTDVISTHKVKVIDCWNCPTTTVAASTLQVKNVGNALSDAMVAAVTGVQTHAASLVEAQKIIAAGTAIRVTGAGGVTMPAADVYVLAIRVA